ncbi:C40 family peptidase [Kingella kingae]|uniref:C40 family peptidase n=1 Tax=Kingella kingae TaxID=504 RepID=UPI00041AE8C9|nr:C40 family peptidase [Kingella kingae]MDK4536396.1 NlpC/P60 family protein [Kingella kingae]MDK4538904.1 NlpC/P60 family protein [Kingella kingae]MDK4547629.1 NlpC/P60 family protein [Kingella kingae]MDK4623447.1 NlpC/P60 family protein [Kingella kingae]MDK4625109.1 NlpC/P60 family protein [Kingella kingae]
MIDLKRIYRFAGCFLLGTSLFSPVHANPDDDPLGQFIQQKQAEQKAAQPDNTDELGDLIRQRTNSNVRAQRPSAAAEQPAPRHNAAPAATATNNSRNRPAAPATPAPQSNSHGDVDDLISSAMGFLGVAYRFGGTSPTGFDCSGFMQYIFRKAFAVNLPRTSAEQATIGTPVSRSQLQPGDMVFFRTAGSRISHVGMYIGNDRFIHAPRTGKNIEITSLSSQYWSTRYATARRVKRNNAQNFIRN